MIGDILRFFDIKLVSLANYLEVSLDYMKSVNSGRRNLKSEDLLQLVPLYEALQSDSDELVDLQIFGPELKEKFKLALKKNIAKKTKTIANKEFELKKNKESYSNMLQGFKACLKMEEKAISNPHHKKWIALHKRHLREKLSERKLEIHFLEAQIQGLIVQKEALIERLEESNGMDGFLR